MTDSLPEQLTNPDDLRLAQHWLDELSSGACEEDAFLRAVQEIVRKDPDAGWDLLSLLDQYYRRGKLKPESFRGLKSQLEGQLLGAGLDIGVSVPLPRREDLPQPKQDPSATAAHAAPIEASAPLIAPGAPGTANAASTVSVAPGTGPREIAVGDLLRGRYRIKSALGHGGTGTVLEAVDQFYLDLPDVDSRVAIKVLHTTVTKRPELLAELRREFLHLQSLSHPNIVRVHEYDRDGDTAFFTMEYLGGLSLGRVLSARRQVALNRPHALTIIRAVGAALAHAHDRRVVHGDLNPGNIFITDDGEVRVLDFGASHTLRRGPWISNLESPEQTPIATPRYASCQVLEGESADARDDLYAFACVAYLLLTGKHPFGQHTALQARSQRLTPRRPEGLSGPAWRALRAGLSFDRDRRPANVERFLKPFDLREPSDHLPALIALLQVSARKRAGSGWLVAAACAVALLAVGWWVATNFDAIDNKASAWGAQLKSAFEDTRASIAQAWQGARPSARPLDESVSPDAASSSSPSSASSSSPPSPPSPPPPPPPRADSSGARSTRTQTGAASPARESGSASSPASSASQAAAAPGAAASSHSGPAPHSRIELAADSVEVPPDEPSAHVVVHRKGNLHGDAGFSWWTESGTAKPGRDFVAVAPREEHIENGKSATSLFVPVVADATRRQPKSFYIVIGDPSSDASLGARTVMMVTLVPPE